MSEICKNCHNGFDLGIWMSPKFKDEKVLLFCSDKCKRKYLKMRLRGIKSNYLRYYEKLKEKNEKI